MKTNNKTNNLPRLYQVVYQLEFKGPRHFRVFTKLTAAKAFVMSLRTNKTYLFAQIRPFKTEINMYGYLEPEDELLFQVCLDGDYYSVKP